MADQTAKSSRSPRRRREKEPLEVRLTVAVRFGEEDDDRVVLMEDRELTMIGSIFRYRDKIAHNFVLLLLRAAMLQPKVARKVLPGLKAVSSRKK